MKHELKAIYIIWLREIIRFWRNRIRAISGLAMPLLWLGVMGVGLSASMRFTPMEQVVDGFNYINFMFPGILAMTLLFSSIFSALSVVYDREFGFLKEILVAPISRSSIALGKILGGATTAVIQAMLMFLLLPIIGVKISILSVILLVPSMFIVAFGLSAFGVLIASKMKSTEAFPMVMQFLMMPMFFLSGALFPLSSAPGWLTAMASFNPLTYGVNLLRGIVFNNAEMPQEIAKALTPSFFGYELNLLANLLIVLGFALLMVALSVWSFRKVE